MICAALQLSHFDGFSSDDMMKQFLHLYEGGMLWLCASVSTDNVNSIGTWNGIPDST